MGQRSGMTPEDDYRGGVRRRKVQRERAVVRAFGVTAAVALVLAAPSLAFSSSVRALVGPARPKPVVAQATLLLSAPVGNGFWAHAWTAPSSTGGQCDFLTTDHRPVVHRPPQVNGGGMCSASTGGERLVQARPDHPLVVGLSISRRLKGDPAKWVPPIVNGAVLPSLKAARVAVVWKGGSLPLRLKDNSFLGGSPLLYMPPFERFPFTVVAYDADGRRVAEKRLESPVLRMMKGWDEYTAAYKRWRSKG
jgi:hypothetical protein